MGKNQSKARKAPVPLCFLWSSLLIRGLGMPCYHVSPFCRRGNGHKGKQRPGT